MTDSGLDLGKRPVELAAGLPEGVLRRQLTGGSPCVPRRSDFSIGHRGAPLRYPEHTRESYVAAARQGAGYVECDVTFTADLELVCRHSQCDLHTTTDVLATPLAEKCRVPFTPARINPDGSLATEAAALCCTSELTLDEFLSLEGKPDIHDPAATDVRHYLGEDPARGTLMSHAQAISLFLELGVKMIPELKKPQVLMPFRGFTREDYAQKLVDELRAGGVTAGDVRLQSFELDDIVYWLDREPSFGRRALFLDGRYEAAGFDHRDPATWSPGMEQLAGMGVTAIGPPLWMLVEAGAAGIEPSLYARQARSAGLEIITWSLERSGSLEHGGGWYYQTLNGLNPGPGYSGSLIRSDSDVLRVLDILARDVGVAGVFSDWPATVTHYANCMGID